TGCPFWAHAIRGHHEPERKKRRQKPCASATRYSAAARSPYFSRNVRPTLQESCERWGAESPTSPLTSGASCEVHASSTLIARPSFPRDGRPLLLLVLLIQEIFLLVFVHLLDRGVQAEDVLVLVVFWPFVETFQRRFEGLDALLIHLTILEGCWEDRSLWLLIAARGPTP